MNPMTDIGEARPDIVAIGGSPGGLEEMPRNAIDRDGMIDFVGPIDAVAAEICRRVSLNQRAAPASSPDDASRPVPGS